MIDPTRERILQCMARFAEIDPDMRFGQLVSWIASLARQDDPQATPNVEDDEFLRACESHLENIERFVAARRDSQIETNTLTTHV
jgi:Fe-S-cluster formation regulator IscX/YfhJ